MKLLQFIFLVVLIYLVFRMLGRYVFPALVKRYINKQKEAYYKAHPEANPDGKEGEINIRRPSDRKQKVNADAAEYIDYEEVENSDNND